MTELLKLSGIYKSFGGLKALKDVSLSVSEGHIVGLIGPNGAGKTTLFNVITGLYHADSGEIFYRGESVSLRSRPDEVLCRGIARTFQNIRLFAEMTALENVMVGRHARTHAGVWGAIRRDARTRAEEEGIIARSTDLLRFVGIEHCAKRRAASLSYGEQRRLEIARALAADPGLLALDEPAAGMNPAETESLRELILKIQGSGVTVLLIEHDVKLIMGLCHQVAVLDFGEMIVSGAPEMVRRHPRVIEAYLGGTE